MRQVGEFEVKRVVESETPFIEPEVFLPDFSPDVLEANKDWLVPQYVDPATGKIILAIQSYVVRTGRHTILVDACVGNDKPRPARPAWHLAQFPYLEEMGKAGVRPEEIDFVMCTHLHIDHVGWNTRLVDGNWVPTFPNAKYVFARTEFEFWQQARERTDNFNEVNKKTFDDSVLPIVDLAEMIDGEHELIADLVHLKPAPGHTPGSMILQLSSKKERALFTGDICHHPIQVYRPTWNSAYCELPDQAIATRHDILESCAAHRTLMLPAHFGPTHAGYVTCGIDGFGFAFA